MNELVQKMIERLNSYPTEEQEYYAQCLLELMAGDQAWEAFFASNRDKFVSMAQEARATRNKPGGLSDETESV